MPGPSLSILTSTPTARSPARSAARDPSSGSITRETVTDNVVPEVRTG
ncbi:MAG: hypothetical protein ACLP4R_25165 [Solirubrobacteraceae bacterium]